MEITCPFLPPADRGDRTGGTGLKDPASGVAAGAAGDHRVGHIPPGAGAVDVAVARGTALRHAKPVERDQRMEACAVEVPLSGCALLVTISRADGAVQVQCDVLQPVTVMEPVGPPAARIGQRVPVPGQGQCPGLEPPICGAGAAWASTALPPTTWRMTWSRARRAASVASPYPDSRPKTDCRNSPSGRWPRSCRNPSFEVQPTPDRTAQGCHRACASPADHRLNWPAPAEIPTAPGGQSKPAPPIRTRPPGDPANPP